MKPDEYLQHNWPGLQYFVQEAINEADSPQQRDSMGLCLLCLAATTLHDAGGPHSAAEYLSMAASEMAKRAQKKEAKNRARASRHLHLVSDTN